MLVNFALGILIYLLLSLWATIWAVRSPPNTKDPWWISWLFVGIMFIWLLHYILIRPWQR